ncbi:MAG: hypothetical protein QW222_01390 [Candidatus Bathyarchaeia archaeon]
MIAEKVLKNFGKYRSHSGISSVTTTIIITGTLLILLVIASFVGTNLLELYMADTEFEQAKTNMILLDKVIQDVALRQGAGGYVQFNQRSGGIGIIQTDEKLRIFVTTALILRPNGDVEIGWGRFGGNEPHYSLTRDQDDSTGIISSKVGDKDILNIDDPPQLAKITSVTVYIKALAKGSDVEEEKVAILWKLSGVEVSSSPFTISRVSYAVYSDTRTKNPLGEYWNWTNLKDLQVGVVVKLLKQGKEEIRASELWVEVNYVPEPNSESKRYESKPLFTLIYRGGSRFSGTDVLLKGDRYLIVDGERSLGYLRVETDEGVQIKLDYNRVRITQSDMLKIGEETVNFVAIALIQVERPEKPDSVTIEESGTLNVKVQNINIKTSNYTYPYGGVNVIVQLSSNPEIYEYRYFSSPMPKTIVLLAEIIVQISMG